MGVGAYSRLGAYSIFYLQDGRLFEVGANSRLGAYSNKYGMSIGEHRHCCVTFEI